MEIIDHVRGIKLAILELKMSTAKKQFFILPLPKHTKFHSHITYQHPKYSVYLNPN